MREGDTNKSFVDPEKTPDVQTIPTHVSAPMFSPLKIAHATKSVYFDLEATGLG